MTVLFADVADFTSLSEKLDPEKIHEIMDGCLRLLVDEIYRYEGTINQYTGDGIMAIFGAPVAHEDHAQRACHAALSLRKPIEQYGKRMRRDYGVDFRLRMGMNSGLVRVGSIGDDLHMEYTAVGDTTNLAARMQAMAKPGSTLVSGNTYKLAGDYFKFKPLGKLSFKGKEVPLEAYELLDTSDVETRIGAAAIRGLTKFVGREHELGMLREAFEKVRSGSGRIIGLAGEAGIGKSRLILELKGMLQGREFLYLEGRCLHYGSSTAYLPILDILRSYFNIKEGLHEHTVKGRMEEKIDALDEGLRYLLPPLHELLSLTVEDKSYVKLNPKQKRERIFEAVRDLLIRESQRRPLVIVIEDLHWIDKTSEEFLTFFIGWLAREHVLLILLFRPYYATSWENKSYCTRLGLDQLPVPARVELVGSILYGDEVSDELRRLIDSRAGGNPLFVEELIYALLENGYIRKGDRVFELSREPWEIRVPDTLQGIIAARMDRLDESVKRTMQVASVIGRSFAILYPGNHCGQGGRPPVLSSEASGTGVHLRKESFARVGI